MRWILVVPGALVPAPLAVALLQATRAPALAMRLGRAAPGDRLHTAAAPGAAHLAWLATAFGERREPPVTAPYARRALLAGSAPPAAAVDPARAPARTSPLEPAQPAPGAPAQDPRPAPDDIVWHVDPVHFALARDDLLVHALKDAAPAAGEAGALLKMASDCARALGSHIDSVGGHWFLTADPPLRVVAAPLQVALGQPVRQHWPQGTDALRWRKLLTEIQIGWHQLASNQRREDAGQAAVNGLWLHGGGSWVALQPPGPLRYEGADPVLRGWSAAAGADANVAADLVSTWDGLFDPARDEAWGDWLARWSDLEHAVEQKWAAAERAGVPALELVLCGASECRAVQLRRADRWKAWRRTDATALAPLLAETASA
jgi:hypothetical protein